MGRWIQAAANCRYSGFAVSNVCYRSIVKAVTRVLLSTGHIVIMSVSDLASGVLVLAYSCILHLLGVDLIKKVTIKRATQMPHQ